MPSEAIFFNYGNIFNLGHNKYMLRYLKGKLENDLVNENKDIINIITKDNLNNIHIVNRGDEYEYIYIWEANDDNNANNDYKIEIGKENKENNYVKFETINIKTKLLSE